MFLRTSSILSVFSSRESFCWCVEILEGDIHCYLIACMSLLWKESQSSARTNEDNPSLKMYIMYS